MKLRVMVLLLFSIAMTGAGSTAAGAAVANDEVTSIKLREADNSGSQDTNTGSGVKTGHIQDGAVSSSKIAASAVTTSKIANGAVTDAKIAGPIMASKISSTGLNADTVDGRHAADLAPAVHTHPTAQVTGLDAALAVKADVIHTHSDLAPLNHTHAYARVYVVSLPGGGGEYESLYDAAVAAQNQCGAGAPCLIKVMPGIYDIGGSAIFLADRVDLEGSGENATIIRGAGGANSLNVGQVINGGGVNEVRSLTVEPYGTRSTLTGIANISQIRNVSVKIVRSAGTTETFGIYAAWMPDLRLDNVKVIVDNATYQSAAGPYAIYIAGGNAVLSSVTVKANGYTAGQAVGVALVSGVTATINSSQIDVLTNQLSYGVSAASAQAFIRNSHISAVSNVPPASGGGLAVFSGSNGKVFVDHSSVYGSGRFIWQLAGEVFVAYSKVWGGTTPPQSGNIGLPVCLGAYDGAYQLITSPNCGLQ